MQPGDLNLDVFLAQQGILPILILSSKEVAALTALDLSMLREDLGMGEPMLAQLRELARTPCRALRCDFEQQKVLLADPVTGEPVSADEK